MNRRVDSPSLRQIRTSSANCGWNCYVCALSRDQPDRVANAVVGLASTVKGIGLARAFEAYRLVDPGSKNPETRSSSSSLIPEPVRTLSEPDKPLLRLASLAPDPVFGRAFQLANVIRDLRQGDRSAAIRELGTLAEKDPSDGLVVMALSDLELAERARGAATSILCSGARTIADSCVASVAAIKSALLAAESGDVAQCRLALDCVRSRDEVAANVLEPWVLRKSIAERR